MNIFKLRKNSYNILRETIFLFLCGIISSNAIGSDMVKRGGVALTFDDRYVDAWYEAHEYLKMYDWRATFFVSQFNALGGDGSALIEKLKTMQDYGHEIGHHTVNHLNAVSYVNEHGIDTYLQNEIIPQHESMTSIGLNVTSFSYPYTLKTDYIDSTLLHVFEIVRGGTYGHIVPQENQGYFDNDRSVLSIQIDDRILSYHYIRSLLEYARDNDKVITFYAHEPVLRAEDIYKNECITYQRLIDICEFVVENDMEFVTFNEFLPKWTTYPVTLSINKQDGTAWSDHGKTFTLKNAANELIIKTMSPTQSGEILTAYVRNGTYKVYDGNTYTGVDILIDGTANNATVNYHLNTVQFLDWDNTLLKSEEVEYGKSSTSPNVPTRDGYIFDGWDLGVDVVTEHLTVTAQYRPATVMITLSSDEIPIGTYSADYLLALVASVEDDAGGTVTYSVSDGELPPGLMLTSTTGQLTGTAEAVGTFTFTVRAMNAASGMFDEKDFSVRISKALIVRPTLTESVFIHDGNEKVVSLDIPNDALYMLSGEIAKTDVGN